MAIEVPTPQKSVRLVDDQGRPTTEAIILLKRLKEIVDDHEARLVAGSL